MLLHAGARCVCFLGAQPSGSISTIPLIRLEVRKWEWSGPPLASICSEQKPKWRYWAWVAHKRSALGSQKTFMRKSFYCLFASHWSLLSLRKRMRMNRESSVASWGLFGWNEPANSCFSSGHTPYPPPGWHIGYVRACVVSCKGLGIVVFFTKFPGA